MRKVSIACLMLLAVMALSVSLVLGQADQAVMQEVFNQTVSVRGLEADPDIPVNYLNREQLEQRMLDDFSEDNPEDEIQAAEDIMVMLGFIEPELDLEDFYVSLLTEQIAGFYDPEDNGLYLISESQSMSPMDRYTLSHEFVHYLQDQNFDLMRPPFHDPDDAEEETDDDASFAATCLVEGDAMIASELWLTKYMDAQDMMEMMAESGEYSSEILDSAPDYIRESLLFPYVEGIKFVRYLHKEGGFDAVDRAFDNPPTTTEQIYHPEKYVSGEGAVEVELADLAPDLGSDWSLEYDNVLGEFDVYQLLEPYMKSRSDLRAASAGWGGNTYHYYRDERGEKLLVQAYAWDSEKDAQEFAAAYVEYVRGRFEGQSEDEPSMGAWRVWSTDDYTLALKVEGANTWLVQATEDEPFEVALEALGEEGDAIDEGALSGGESGSAEDGLDMNPLIIGSVIALLVLGIALVIAMFVIYRRPPGPPAQPPSGTYGPYAGPPGQPPTFQPPPSAQPPPPPVVPPPGPPESPGAEPPSQTQPPQRDG